jgi:hypothetical protein
MKNGSWRHVAGAVALLCLSHSAPALAQSGRNNLFERLAGSWSGGGGVKVGDGDNERVRCRADYLPSSSSQLRLNLRCASDSFNLQVVSDIMRQGNRISGTWSETTYNVSGDLSGSVSNDQLLAVVEGVGLSARLTLAVRGNAQTVTLASQGQVTSSASVTLRRQ